MPSFARCRACAPRRSPTSSAVHRGRTSLARSGRTSASRPGPVGQGRSPVVQSIWAYKGIHHARTRCETRIFPTIEISRTRRTNRRWRSHLRCVSFFMRIGGNLLTEVARPEGPLVDSHAGSKSGVPSSVRSWNYRFHAVRVVYRSGRVDQSHRSGSQVRRASDGAVTGVQSGRRAATASSSVVHSMP